MGWLLLACGGPHQVAEPASRDLDGALAAWAEDDASAREVTRIAPDPRPLTAPVRIGEQAREPEPRVGARGRRPIDVSFERAPLAQALQVLADAAGVGLVVAEGVEGEVSLTLRRVQPLEAMRALAEAHGVSLTFVGGNVIARGL